MSVKFPGIARVLIFVLLMSVQASAQMLTEQAPPMHRIIHRNTFALRVNPLGLLYEGRFVYRLRLYESDKVAFRDNFIGFGIAPMLSPAFVRIGPYVEFSPATFITLWGSYTFAQYFGTFDSLQSFNSATGNFGDATLASRGKLPVGDVLRPGPRNGGELTVGADLQIKVASFVIRSRSRLVRPDMNLRDGDVVFYDQFYDVLAPNKGFYFTTDFDLLYQTLENRLILGARYTGTVPLYDTRHFLPSETAVNLNTMHRVGPFLGYTFFSRDGATFNNPTVFLLVQWWVQHRFRAGQEISQALPLIGAGFQITGDFLPVK